jgi:hypothetical protein
MKQQDSKRNEPLMQQDERRVKLWEIIFKQGDADDMVSVARDALLVRTCVRIGRLHDC